MCIVLGKVAKGGQQLRDNDRHACCRSGQKDRLADSTPPQLPNKSLPPTRVTTSPAVTDPPFATCEPPHHPTINAPNAMGTNSTVHNSSVKISDKDRNEQDIHM
jgi:hypothetical protein